LIKWFSYAPQVGGSTLMKWKWLIINQNHQIHGIKWKSLVVNQNPYIDQVKMVGGQPKTTRYKMNHWRTEESKRSSLDPFNNLLTLHLTGGDIEYQWWKSRFKVRSPINHKNQTTLGNSTMATGLLNYSLGCWATPNCV
jgi:hypothetical protein